MFVVQILFPCPRSNALSKSLAPASSLAAWGATYYTSQARLRAMANDFGDFATKAVETFTGMASDIVHKQGRPSRESKLL